MQFGIGLVLFPFSWHLGFWPREKKTIFALGPLRLVIYRATGEWKPLEQGWQNQLDGECATRLTISTAGLTERYRHSDK